MRSVHLPADIYQRFIHEEPSIALPLAIVNKASHAGFSRGLSDICDRPISPSEINTYLVAERPDRIGFIVWSVKVADRNITATRPYSILFPYENVSISVFDRTVEDFDITTVADAYQGLTILAGNDPANLSFDDEYEYSLKEEYEEGSLIMPDAMTMYRILLRRLSCHSSFVPAEVYAAQTVLATLRRFKQITEPKIFDLYIEVTMITEELKMGSSLMIDSRLQSKEHKKLLFGRFDAIIDRFFRSYGVSDITPFDGSKHR